MRITIGRIYFMPFAIAIEMFADIVYINYSLCVALLGFFLKKLISH